MSEFRNAYFKGQIIPYGDAKVGVGTHALNYGTAVFGGIRGYWNAEKSQLSIFRPHDHYRRLLNSGAMLHMNIGETPESLTRITLDLLKADGWDCDVYIRPLIYKSLEGIGVRLHDIPDEFTIFASAFHGYVSNDTGAHVTVSSWRRIDDNVIPARGKISGAYVNSALIKSDAVQSGYDEALVLTHDGHVAEGSAMNIFMIRDGILITPPVNDNILEGITRRSLIEVARNELGLTVLERSIDRTEVFICDELFMSGTAAQISAIAMVDHRPVGNGKMGPITTKLREVYDDVVHMRNPRYAQWSVVVE
jgi:branched-chain amino acid aminotransferase